MLDGAKRSADAIAEAKAEAANTSWRWERTPGRRANPKVQLALAAMWLVLATLNATVQDDEAIRWMWGGIGVFWLILGAVALRQVRRQRAATA